MEHPPPEDLWQIVPRETQPRVASGNTNCTMPKELLDRVLSRDRIKLPLFFKITNLSTNQYAISVADQFLEMETETHLALISPIVIQFLGETAIAQIDCINQSPDLMPHKAKRVIFEPLDLLFYKLKDPKKTLEKILQDTHVLGIGYQIPIVLKTKTIHLRVADLIDPSETHVLFADINHVDLEVDFVPIKPPPTPVVSSPTNQVIRKVKPRTATVPTTSTVPEQPPLYQPDKTWIPFCGWGRVLSTGEYVKGVPQDP